MKKNIFQLPIVFLLILLPFLTFAQSDKKAAEAIGTKIIAVLFIVVVIAIFNWVRSKKK